MDKAIDTLHDTGIEVNLYMRRTPSCAAMKKSPTDSYPPREEYVASYEDFAFRLASRYKGKVKSYQIWGGEADGTEKLAIRLGKDRAWFLSSPNTVTRASSGPIRMRWWIPPPSAERIAKDRGFRSSPPCWRKSEGIMTGS